MHGSGKAVLNIINQVLEKGVEVHIVLPEAKGNLFSTLNRLNIGLSILPVAVSVWPKLYRPLDYLIYPLRIVRLFVMSLYFYTKLLSLTKKVNPDIIHTNIGVVNTGYFVSKKLGINHVWHVREYQDLDFGWTPFPSKRVYENFLKDSINHPIVITNGVYKHFNLHFDRKGKIIYDGVIDKTVVPQINSRKKNYFLFVGTISEGKGTFEAIQAFLEGCKDYPSYEFLIAGGGDVDYINRQKKAFSTKKGFSRVKFLGYRTDISKLMAESIGLIVPSKFEGFGFITTEAMYNGCLVIGKNTGGTKEQFDNGLNCTGSEIGIRYNKTEDLAQILKQICTSGITPYLSKLRDAQRTVLEMYSTQKNASEIYNLYNKIVSSNYD